MIIQANDKWASICDSLASIIPHAASILLREMYSEICSSTKQQIVVTDGEKKV